MKGENKENWKIIDADGNILGSIDVSEPKNYFLPESEPTVAAEPPMLDYRKISPLVDYLGMSAQDMAAMLDVDRTTLIRWKKENKALGKLRSKVIYDMDHLIAKGVRVFGSESSFEEWLNLPNYALGDKKPLDLLKDPYGLEKVDDAIEAMMWGNML